MILVFDLDDTLYDESTYVLSGMHAVAKYLSVNLGKPEKEIYQRLVSVLMQQGRGSVFDEVLKEYKNYTKKNVSSCLSVYRKHEPRISLSKDGLACLTRFKSLSKYLVTDGNKIVQMKKIKALGIEAYFKKCFRTYQYGLKYSKPSPYCFHKICKLENTVPSAVVYIGDNPHKDFINLKREGFQTIRIKQGMFKNVTLDKNHEADHTILSLDELTPEFIKHVFNS